MMTDKVLQEVYIHELEEEVDRLREKNAKLLKIISNFAHRITYYHNLVNDLHEELNSVKDKDEEDNYPDYNWFDD